MSNQLIPDNKTSLQPLTATQQKLAEENLKLASWTAKKYYCRLKGSLPFDDLYSEALWGLVWGAATFDPELGVPFEPYARITIRSRLKVFLRDHFRERRQRFINFTDLATRRGQQVDFPVDAECEHEARQERKGQIEIVRRALPKRWFDLLHQHFVEGIHVSRIARSLGITTQRAHQIMKRAIGILHESKSLRSKRLLRILNIEHNRTAKEVRCGPDAPRRD